MLCTRISTVIYFILENKTECDQGSVLGSLLNNFYPRWIQAKQKVNEISFNQTRVGNFIIFVYLKYDTLL